MSNHRKLNPKAFLLVFVGLFLAIAVACGASPTSTPLPTLAYTPVPTATPAPTPAPSGGGKYGGDIRMSAYADTRDWDPLGSASLSSIQAYSQLYNQVVQYDTEDIAKIVCDLCSDWEVSNGGQRFTFNLRPKPIPRWDVHFGGFDEDRKDSTAPHITLRPQPGGHRQGVLAICTFHLGFSLVSCGRTERP